MIKIIKKLINKLNEFIYQIYLKIGYLLCITRVKYNLENKTLFSMKNKRRATDKPHLTLNEQEFRDAVVEQLESKGFRDWFVPLLLSCLIGIISFFGAKWIQNIESETFSNREQIKIVTERQIQTSGRLDNIELNQKGFAEKVGELSYKVDQQLGDIRNISGNLVKVETKLDFLISKKGK